MGVEAFWTFYEARTSDPNRNPDPVRGNSKEYISVYSALYFLFDLWQRKNIELIFSQKELHWKQRDETDDF